jgi:hypothetical protein
MSFSQRFRYILKNIFQITIENVGVSRRDRYCFLEKITNQSCHLYDIGWVSGELMNGLASSKCLYKNGHTNLYR